MMLIHMLDLYIMNLIVHWRDFSTSKNCHGSVVFLQFILSYDQWRPNVWINQGVPVYCVGIELCSIWVTDQDEPDNHTYV